MAIRLITAPAVEPITLAQAKAHLRIDFSADDTLISALIPAARTYCEQWTARAFAQQTLELVLDAFPAKEILIPMPPLQSVISVKYDDANGVEQTLGIDQYDVDNVNEPGWVVPSTSGWPSNIFQGINSVRIRYIAGYTPDVGNSPPDVTMIPSSLKAAMLLYIGQLYDHREDLVIGTNVMALPSGNVDFLLRQYRVALGMA